MDYENNKCYNEAKKIVDLERPTSSYLSISHALFFFLFVACFMLLLLA